MDLLREHGGSPGIRDPGLLESALARPRHKWTYKKKPDLSELAAAYGYGLARNHGFVDGNKRIAFMAMYVFLLINGQELEAPEPEVVSLMLAVAEGTMSEKDLVKWVSAHVKKFRGKVE
jgi:death-on-curing protein